MAVKRDIKYLNRDFASLRTSLLDYARTYFPTTYNDFTPASPGVMFMEMSAYVGDVMSFYLDNQIQETYLQYAKQTNNLYELSYMFGYRPKVTGVATAMIDFYQQVPAKLEGSTYVPDFDYALLIDKNATITSNSNRDTTFIVQDNIDFATSSSVDPTEITIYQVASGDPVSYLLKKSRPAISATINTTTFSFTTPTQFDTRTITDTNIIGILDITDSDGNIWYEVDYLGQDTVYKGLKNTNPNTPTLNTDSDAAYILELESVQRRFTSRFLNATTLQLQFGSGTATDTDENIVPNPDNVGLGLPIEQSKLTTAYSPTNFIFTDTYGIAPSNTTLTIRYLTGGGVTANVPANDLTTLSGTINYQKYNLNTTTANQYRNTVAVNNPTAASGGGSGDTEEEIRQNALATFPTQLRTITPADYEIRALSLPSSYGTIAKAHTEQTELKNLQPGETPTTLDTYILTYDLNKNLITASDTLKNNLKTYLSQYRMLGDSIRIKDAYVVNIQVVFDIVVNPNYNSLDVLLQTTTELQNYFKIDNWQINQPILLKELYLLLDKVDGVQTVKNVTVTNLAGEALGYSNYSYDVQGATIDNTIYPSLDPMIFEVKYPNTDIKGRVVSL